MMKQKNIICMADLKSEPVGRLLWRLSPPVMFALLVQALYNLVDSVFIAQCGESGLTALSILFPVQLLVQALATGTGTGLNALFSRYQGEKRNKEAQEIAQYGWKLGIFNWICFVLVSMLLLRPYLFLSSDNPEVIAQGLQYGIIVLVFSFGMFMEGNFTKILQAGGNMVIPMIAQVFGALLNILLDPLLIFGLWGFPALGITGAAIATVLGQSVAMLITMWAIHKQGLLHNAQHKLSLPKVQKIYRAGLPSIMMQSLYTFYIVGLNLILAGFTEQAVTVLGIYYKLQTFFFIPIFGFEQVVLPIFSYCYGAGLKQRLRIVFIYASGFTTIFLGIATIIFCAFPVHLLHVFQANTSLLHIGIPAFQIIGASFLFISLPAITMVFFQAVDCPLTSAALVILRQVILLVPFAWILSHWGLQAVWYTFPLTEIITFTAALIFLWKKKNLLFEPQKGRVYI